MNPDLAKPSRAERLHRLLRDRTVFLGLAFLAISAGAYLASTGSETRLGPHLTFLVKWAAIIFAEVGAVLFSIRYLHLTYENFLRDEYKNDFALAMRQIIKAELGNPDNVRLFIDGAKMMFGELGKRDLESYWAFQRFGIRSVHENLETNEIRRRLGSARKIRVLKTWFPDHQDIEVGLQEAMAKPKAEVTLLLSHPDSPLLRERSIGAGQNEKHGLEQVERTLRKIYKGLHDGAESKFEIGLYHGWPGCPIIWYGEDRLQHVLLGFYFRGKSSPYWPWIEIEAGSKFDEILDEQFTKLWAKTPDKISNREQLAEWLKKRKLL